MTKLIFFRYSDTGLLYPAKGALKRKLHPMLMFSRHRKSRFSVKNVGEKRFLTGSNVHGTLGSSFSYSPATVATTIQSKLLFFAVTSMFCPNSYPQQDILRLAGIQCQNTLSPQPEIQTWKLHHRGKMVLLEWKSLTLLKQVTQSYKEFSQNYFFR